MQPLMNRRTALKTLTSGAVVAGTSLSLSSARAAAEPALKGRIRKSVCRWCFPKLSVEELAIAAQGMGLVALDLITPPDFDTVKKAGLTVSLVSNPVVDGPGGVKVGGIGKAWNRLEHHDALVAAYEVSIKQTADAGLTQLICFSGNREGLADEQGIENCATGLKRILPTAEKLGVTLVMELLNSKVNHKDYMCDRSNWGVELSNRLSSERFKLLYDIYHMQIMEGDVIATIKAHHSHFSHYHTAGVPGRAEIGDNQELFYPAIMRAIADTGFKGFVAQEFIPKGPDPLASLRDSVRICDV